MTITDETIDLATLPRKVEDPEFIKACQRFIAAAGRRVGEGNIDALPLLIDLRADLANAVSDAVHGLVDCGGYSYGEIGSRLGMSRQSVHERWGRRSGDPASGST